MCALVQAIRKVGIGGSGPGLGAASNPMHIVRTNKPFIEVSQPSSDRPSSSGSQSFGQQIIEDPRTDIANDRNSQISYKYYAEENLDMQLTDSVKATEQESFYDGNVERSLSFGRRKKLTRVDLEKGGVY